MNKNEEKKKFFRIRFLIENFLFLAGNNQEFRENKIIYSLEKNI